MITPLLFFASVQTAAMRVRQNLPAPPFVRATEPYKVGNDRRSYYFWLDRLVDRCVVVNPPIARFHSRAAYEEAERFRSLIDLSEPTPNAAGGPKRLPTAEEAFHDALVLWRQADAHRRGFLPATSYEDVLASLQRARETPGGSEVLHAYIDLTDAVCSATAFGLKAKDRIYEIELRWRQAYPHTALLAAASIARLYEEAKDEENEGLTRTRIRVRYGALSEFDVFERWSYVVKSASSIGASFG